ncbi:NADP-dependent malic enzyme isoform X1 [Octopus bimaculoides]|uniref:Malic enzyme n=1 Tax=Octopus bimaculoides TaxID=37653 RepID=A0A0L8IG73_OCTBM|nr:NADP-dependent malic enzyme isoform X1 [Octopus bimaculoides]|eukprot:XP_014767925.1 PREDICTED: NADP-dependent malic enzyme-like isoform X1 [Octopus bimaculoides]
MSSYLTKIWPLSQRTLRANSVSVGNIHTKTMDMFKTSGLTWKESSAKHVSQAKSRGIDIIRNPRINKSLAFTLRERQIMGIHGLLPPCIITQDQQAYRVMENFRRRPTDLDKYIYLTALLDRNERLFYKVLTEHVEEMMPIVYTPTVGLACQQYGLLFRRPRGLFISIKDKGHIFDILCNWPDNSVKAIVVTDGERILGLGDLGAYGMGIPVGKLSLYTALGGIHPSKCLPILLDVGTNNEVIRNDPLYIGLNMPRATGKEYDEFIDEFMQAVVRRYGQNTLIQFEDFANHNAFRLLQEYRDQYCTFNDDIQGTAAVAAAGIIASMRITKRKLIDNLFLFQGAGEANIGIANLVALAMIEEGSTEAEAFSKIWMVDSRGLLVKNRPSGGVTGHKLDFAKDHAPVDTFDEAVEILKPTAIIGASAVAGAFTEKIIRNMAKYNERPIIFALSNPTSKAECTAEQAYTFSEGRCVFASGSPFNPVTLNGKTYYTGQGNNAYIFPGVAMAVLTCGARHIPEAIFLHAAQKLAELVKDSHLEEGRVYPPLNEINEVSTVIAASLAEYMYREGIATTYPEPADKDAFIRTFIYNTDYEDFVPPMWDWKE